MTEQSKTNSIVKRPMVGMRMILSLAVAALVSITVIGVGSIAERNAREALRLEMQTRLLLEARHLALLSADALLTDFPELTLVPVVRKMEDDRGDLAYAVVLDHKGFIQGHDDPRYIGQSWEIPSSLEALDVLIEMESDEVMLGNNSVMVARVPVLHVGGRRVGSAVVGIYRSHLDAMVTSARKDLILVTAGLLAVAVLVAIMIMRRLLRPVGALQRGLERIGRGDLNTPMHLNDRTELGLLAETVNDMAAQLKSSQEEMLAKEQEVIETQAEVIHTLGEVVENRSQETANHTVRVGQYAYLLAGLAGLDEDEALLLQRAAPMHDIGKIGIPDAILNKPGRYSDEEHDLMKRHATIGYSILARSKREVLQAAALVAHQHHEKWDGSGYPNGLSGENIHIFGRIVAIADVFDALSFDRVYRKAMPLPQVLETMQKGYGTHFDPRLMDLFLENVDDFVAIKKDHEEELAGQTYREDWSISTRPEAGLPVDIRKREPVEV